jgi:GNAT superfamily N-acetyltransferase
LLKITPLREDHLEAAAELVSRRFRHLLQQIPYLPAQYAIADTFLPMLKDLQQSSGGGLAAFSGNRLVGFLAGWKMASFRGKPSVYSPEWANGADAQDSSRIYESLYSRMSAEWLAEKFSAHYISLFPDDLQALNTWNWLGFGMAAVDAMRRVDPLPEVAAGVDIRRAGPQDLERVIEIQEDLYLYHTRSPIFLMGERKERGYYLDWLQDPNKEVWLAFEKGEPAAFMRLGPADPEVAAIIRDEKTTSIYGAYTKENMRRTGLGAALLAHALQYAQEAGYERCAVSFEPMNPLGKGFWLKTFTPVCLTMARFVDERLIAESPG